MRILGGMTLVIAAIAMCLAISAFIEAEHLQSQLDGLSGAAKAVGTVTGLVGIDEIRIEGLRVRGMEFLIATGVLGLLGLLFCLLGGGSAPASQPAAPNLGIKGGA